MRVGGRGVGVLPEKNIVKYQMAVGSSYSALWRHIWQSNILDQSATGDVGLYDIMPLIINGLMILGVGVKPVRTLKPLAFPMIIFLAILILSKFSPHHR